MQRVRPRAGRPASAGWRAYLTTDEDEPAEAIVYCPECAEREFGVNLLDDATRGPRKRLQPRLDTTFGAS